jgi:hypothetical protein
MIQESRDVVGKRPESMPDALAYRKVLMAVYILANKEGLACEADDPEIGRQCGLGVGTVRKCLTLMRYKADVMVFGRRDGLPYRVIVLMDHPEADELVLRVSKLRHRRESR